MHACCVGSSGHAQWDGWSVLVHCLRESDGKTFAQSFLSWAVNLEHPDTDTDTLRTVL